MDTEYDRVRMVRDKKYRYLYNYSPEKPYYQDIAFRLDIPMMKEILEMRKNGTLPASTAAWFNTKPAEELYDVEKDPWEMHNLAANPAYKAKLEELRGVFKAWAAKVGDMAEMPEKDMVSKWWGGKAMAPETAIPVIAIQDGKASISCATPGASIGYRILRPGTTGVDTHTVQTWDYGLTMGFMKNGTSMPAQPVWAIFDGHPISLQAGDTLVVQAMRIGFKAAVAKYY
jgi:hypothetical protein